MIDREAGDKKKGDRFQKLRACIRLLTEIGADKNKRIACAIELLEDSLLLCDGPDAAHSIEENKNYGSSLTLNSAPVRNTLVAFIDLDFRYFGNSPIKLCFFASATTGDERFDKSIFAKAGLSEVFNTSILKKLCAKLPLSADEMALCRASVLCEYEKQYSSHAGGNLAALSAWSAAQIGAFLERIEWVITSDGNQELENQAIDRIRQCPFFSYRHEGMEQIIVAGICDIFEKFSEQSEPIARLITTSDVENIFLKALGIQGVHKPLDPAYQNWKSIDLSDVRNLEEKIEAVVSDYSKSELVRLTRRVGLAKDEASLWQREYVALRRRIFDVCDEILYRNRVNRISTLSANDIDLILDEMVEKSMEELTRLNRTYHYRIQDTTTIRGAILSLFDECYLAFD